MNSVLLRSIFPLGFFIIGNCFATAPAPDSLKGRPNADSVLILDKMIVTASRTKRLISETPANVSVIDKNDMGSSSAKTIEDLLKTQTGVQVKRSVGIGEGVPSDIIIRGIPGALAAARTLILVDGIPTNASGTPFLIVNEIPMDAIERVEIVRGPYSSLYGANAFGGVINIITSDGFGELKGNLNVETGYPFIVADQYLRKNKSMSASLKEARAQSYWNFNGTGSVGTDKFAILANAGYRTIGNYILRDYAIVTDSTYTYPIPVVNRDYSEIRFFGKSKYYPSDNSEIALHLRYFKSELGYGKTKNILPDSMDIVMKGDRFLFGSRLRKTISNAFSLHAGGYYRRFSGEFWKEVDTGAAQSAPCRWNSQTNDWQVDAQGFLKAGSDHTVMIGGDLLRNSADFGAFINPATGRILPKSFPKKKAIFNGAGYVQDEVKLFDRLNIVPVVRLDYHSEFGSAFSPKLGISYKISDLLRFHSSSGRSFRAPSLSELYLPDFPAYNNWKLEANPNLKPEYIWGFDAGFDMTPNKAFSLKIGTFYNSMTDLIGLTLDLQKRNYLTHQNIASAWSEGIEAEIAWTPLPWLMVSAQGTIEDSKDEFYDTPLDYIPNYLFGCRILASQAFERIKIECQIGFNYVGARSYLDFYRDNVGVLLTPEGPKFDLSLVSAPPYGTFDLSCKVSFLKKLWFVVTAQNIFNVEYVETRGDLSPGRFASLKIGMDF